MHVSEIVDLMDEKGPRLADEALQDFERELGYRLPDDYRQFLLACNGGSVEADVLFQGKSNQGKEECGLGFLCGLREDADGDFSLRGIRKLMQGRIPKELLTIGGDLGGNDICIGLFGSSAGRIFFFDHDEEFEADDWDGRVETLEHIRPLANSFSDFVSGLRLMDD